MSGVKLSDRIINSAKMLTDAQLAHPIVSKLYLNGSTDGRNGKQVISRLIKYLREGMNGIQAIFRAAANKAETAQEKQLIEQLVDNLNIIRKRYDALHKENFGEIDKLIATEKLPQNVWSYKQHLFAESVNGSYADLLAMMLTVVMPSRIASQVKDKQGFVSNPYYDFSVNDRELIDAMVLSLKSLIDSKESTVSDEQQNRMKELFKRTLYYHNIVYDAIWDKDSSIQFF